MNSKAERKHSELIDVRRASEADSTEFCANQHNTSSVPFTLLCCGKTLPLCQHSLNVHSFPRLLSIPISFHLYTVLFIMLHMVDTIVGVLNGSLGFLFVMLWNTYSPLCPVTVLHTCKEAPHNKPLSDLSFNVTAMQSEKGNLVIAQL